MLDAFVTVPGQPSHSLTQRLHDRQRSSRHRIKGAVIACEVDVTSCGAKLKSSLQNFRMS